MKMTGQVRTPTPEEMARYKAGFAATEETYTRDQLAWAIQGIMAPHLPDDNEDSWPTKFSYEMADAIIDGSVYHRASRAKHINWMGRRALQETLSEGFDSITLLAETNK